MENTAQSSEGLLVYNVLCPRFVVRREGGWGGGGRNKFFNFSAIVPCWDSTLFKITSKSTMVLLKIQFIKLNS